jgi:hypothetical protein
MARKLPDVKKNRWEMSASGRKQSPVEGRIVCGERRLSANRGNLRCNNCDPSNIMILIVIIKINNNVRVAARNTMGGIK